jgi:hypothetical protein
MIPAEAATTVTVAWMAACATLPWLVFAVPRRQQQEQ